MKKFILVATFIVASVAGFGQSKKEAKANKIKSTTVWQADNENGKANTYKDSYEEFDKNGNTVSKIEYAKDGSIKKQETYKFDAYQNKTEETIFDLKDNTNKKKIYKYNATNDKTEETEYNSSGAVVKKTTYTYNSNGDKSSETITDASGNVTKKAVYNYNTKNLKNDKQTFNNANILESVKKYVYEYF